MERVTLEGARVQLSPLMLEDAEGLWEAARDTDPFRHMPVPIAVHGVAAMRTVVEGLLARPQCLPMTQRVDGAIAGMTGYWSFSERHRSVEIGSTWLTRRLQGTGVNVEGKLLLMRHAFGPLDCMRVEFKTDARNLRSQRALEGVGAVREGVLRSHRTMREGPRRDSVYYSVLREEWPDVERQLQARLARG